MKKPRVLVVIPARGGSKRIRGKNIRSFAGKPLIAHTILQARSLPFADRIIVDTDSREIARIAKHHGAEVPFLRPAHLATDSSQSSDSILHLMRRLSKEGYASDYVLVLQTTSPLREVSDIVKCWELMQKGDATTVLTVAPTHPRLYHLDRKQYIHLANRSAKDSTNTQDWPDGYLLNGCFVYLIRTSAFVKERKMITSKTKAVIAPRWRSVDLDTTEDWVMAEFIYKNRHAIEKRMKRLG